MKNIKIESNVKYLSDSQEIKALPKNCLFDKGKVGCGGTTLALTSNEPYVIAVPFISLIENKVGQYEKGKIFAFYGGKRVKDLKDYVKDSQCPIIMTTYDSLDLVSKNINTSDFKLLVDEYHLLFTQYAFRDDAVNSVLSNFKKYKEYCFMTATPLEDEFILEELKDLDVVVAEWSDVSDVLINSIVCPKGVVNTCVDLINSFLNGEENGNLYLFVNSVNFIKDLVANTNVTNDNCNVIYSLNNKTDVGLNRGVLPSKKDNSIPTKKINLLTSTVFEGSDIYDEDGRTFIVSDSSKAHTLTDISTSFQQIAGRIRNSKYSNEITHLYTNTRYNELSYEQFKEFSLKEVVIAKNATNAFNQLDKASREYLISAGVGTVNETYISVNKDTITFNPNLVKLDLFNFKVCKHLYKIRVNNLQNEYDKYGFTSKTYSHSSTTKISKSDIVGFEETVKHIESFYHLPLMQMDKEQLAYLQASYLKYPFLSESIEKLGFEGIKNENYVITNIKRKLDTLLNVNTETKIFKLLKSYNDITAGNFVSSATLKNRFKDIYTRLGLNLTAKGSDIQKYFNVNMVQKRIDGKKTEGFIIISNKIIIKD